MAPANIATVVNQIPPTRIQTERDFRVSPVVGVASGCQLSRSGSARRSTAEACSISAIARWYLLASPASGGARSLARRMGKPSERGSCFISRRVAWRAAANREIASQAFLHSALLRGCEPRMLVLVMALVQLPRGIPSEVGPAALF